MKYVNGTASEQLQEMLDKAWDVGILTDDFPGGKPTVEEYLHHEATLEILVQGFQDVLEEIESEN